MKYCTKCGYQLIDTAKFCNSCGAPVAPGPQETTPQPAQTVSDNPYENSTPAHTAPQYNQYTQPVYYQPQPKTEEQLRAEEQNFLNRIDIGLKHTALAWRIGGIAFTVLAVLMILSVVINITTGDMETAVSDIMSAILYIPSGIIGFIMASKVSKYRSYLYTDCKDGISHFSVGSIVLGAFFNTIAMIFIIVYFTQVKSNHAVIDRIKSRQDAYNAQQ